MRRHLSQQDALHHQAAASKQTALQALQDVSSSEARHPLMKQIIQADDLKRRAEAHDGAWDCSTCHETYPKGKHVAVQVAGILADRGQVERSADDPERGESAMLDLPPLVKDYPGTHRPYLYLCHDCAINAGIVSQAELETGRRQDNLNGN